MVPKNRADDFLSPKTPWPETDKGRAWYAELSKAHDRIGQIKEEIFEEDIVNWLLRTSSLDPDQLSAGQVMNLQYEMGIAAFSYDFSPTKGLMPDKQRRKRALTPAALDDEGWLPHPDDVAKFVRWVKDKVIGRIAENKSVDLAVPNIELTLLPPTSKAGWRLDYISIGQRPISRLQTNVLRLLASWAWRIRACQECKKTIFLASHGKQRFCTPRCQNRSSKAVKKGESKNV